jgi:D-alanyl-D-alanine carboxypeptidase (penicillin-binding protein 5/6)
MKPTNLSDKIKKQERSRRDQRIALGLIGAGVVLGGALFVCVPAISSQINELNTPAINKEAAVAAAIATTTPTNADAYSHLNLIAKSAIVYDLTDGKVLYAQNAYEQLPLASITKLLTLYAATSVLSPSSTVTMTPVALSQDGDAADNGFTAGETFSFEDLARLTLAASSNDGAEAIAEAADTAANTTTNSLLSNAASSLGLTQTYAVNSSGLDVSTTQSGGYGSAHDIAVLAGALIKKSPDIAQATTLPSISVTSQQGIAHSFANTDIDVTHFPNLLLSKTGETDLAGGNLVIVYDSGIDHPIAIVVLGSTETGRFTDMQQLMRATLSYFGDAPVPLPSLAPTT